MNDDLFLDRLRDRFDDAHASTPGAGSPPPDLWTRVLSDHTTGRSRTVNATMSPEIAEIRPAPRSRRTIRQEGRSRRFPGFGYSAAAILLVLALFGGMFVANQRGPDDRFGDLRYAAQPVSPEATAKAAQQCDVEPLSEDQVIEMVQDPESWVRNESNGEVSKSPWPVDVNGTVGTMIFAQPGIGRAPNDQELQEMQEVVDTYLACWSSGSMPQIWALMDPHRIRDQVVQSGGPMYSDGETEFRVGQLMDNPARWLIPDPSFDPNQIEVFATTNPERARIQELNDVTIGYVGTDTYDLEGELVQSADWLDRRDVEADEHDIMGLSFGTVTLLKYPGIDRWFVHDVIVGEVDWRGLDLTPVASPAAVSPRDRIAM